MDFEDVCRAVVTAAKNGDMTAAKIIIDRLIPPRKGRPIAFDLPDIKAASDIAKAFGMVAQAVSAGDLTPDEAGTVASVLEAHRKTLEMCELEQRIAALEARDK